MVKVIIIKIRVVFITVVQSVAALTLIPIKAPRPPLVTTNERSFFSPFVCRVHKDPFDGNYGNTTKKKPHNLNRTIKDYENYGNTTTKRPHNFDQTIEDKNCTLTDLQIKRKFKHAHQFGVDGPYNRLNGELWKNALKDHMDDPETRLIIGTYRSPTQPVRHYYNNRTELDVIVNETTGEFVTGFKLLPSQKKNLENIQSVR